MITYVSIGNDPAIVRSMSTSLGGYIRDRRTALGFKTQSDFAEKAGINRAHLSQIESGKIALPNAELRRKLASALGVSHLDILIAAGELNESEVEESGVVGTVEASPIPEVVSALLTEVQWDQLSTELIANQIRFIRDSQRGTLHRQLHDPTEVDRKR